MLAIDTYRMSVVHHFFLQVPKPFQVVFETAEYPTDLVNTPGSGFRIELRVVLCLGTAAIVTEVVDIVVFKAIPGLYQPRQAGYEDCESLHHLFVPGFKSLDRSSQLRIPR